MKHEELFEVMEPPPHGLTRLRGKMASRRASRLLWPALVTAFAAAAVLLLVPRGEAPADLSTPFAHHLLGEGAGPVVSALDTQRLAVEQMP